MILPAWTVDNQLMVDGEWVGDWLRKRPYTVYVAGPLPVELPWVMTPDDSAIGRPGTMLGVTLKCDGKGETRIMRGDTWGYRGRDPVAMMDHIQSTKDECIERSIPWKPTAAATTAKLLARFVRLRPLVPRWRDLMHAALHAGPIAHIRGGAAWGAHIDVKSAYLHALTQPMPCGGWFLSRARGRRVATMLAKDGIAVATVYIQEDSANSEFGALPVQMSSGRMFYPTGIVRGVWPTTLLRPAVERGDVEIIDLHYMVIPRRFDPIFEEYAAFVAELPKAVGKPLYTRLWGKMASRGWWKGTRVEQPGGGIYSGWLWWQYQGRPSWRPGSPSYYCPDLSAWIVSINHANITATARTLAPDSIIAAHVDALWTSDTEGARAVTVEDPKSGEWKLEGEGEIRYYTQGRYCVQGLDYLKFGYNGMTARPTDAEAFDEQCHQLAHDVPPSRRWNGDPNLDIEAWSEPPFIDGSARLCDPIGGLDPTDTDIWNERGYPHDDVLERLEADWARQTDDDWTLPDDERAEIAAMLRREHPDAITEAAGEPPQPTRVDHG